MADEATVTGYIQIIDSTGTFQFISKPESFTADVSTTRGPSPGGFAALAAGNGTLVDLSNLSTPALVVFHNYDDTHYVDIGLVIGGTFYALFELQAQEQYPMRFSRNIDTSPTLIYMRASPSTVSCEVAVNAFDD